MLTKEQMRKLKSQAHHLKPVIQIGKLGTSESLIRAVDAALTDHELIKVKFMEFKDERKDLAAEVAEATESELVDIIGNIAILFRRSPDEKKRKIFA